MSDDDDSTLISGEEEEAEDEEQKVPENFTFFSDLSMQELIFGVGTIGVNALCLGMMLNIPTLTLHNLMYKVASKGLVHTETSDQDRVAVCKAIVDHWIARTVNKKPKARFKELHNVFVVLREKEIAAALKEKFEKDEPISLEMFLKFDLGRLGPYVPPVLEVMDMWGGEEEGYYEDEED